MHHPHCHRKLKTRFNCEWSHFPYETLIVIIGGVHNERDIVILPNDLIFSNIFFVGSHFSLPFHLTIPGRFNRIQEPADLVKDLFR